MNRFLLTIFTAFGLVGSLILTVDVVAEDTETTTRTHDVAALAPVNGTIGYAVTWMFAAIYQTPDGREECPNGNNMGPRERFSELYPEGSHRPLVETQLKHEIEIWHPSADGAEEFPYFEAQGKYALGINLDGEIGPNDFTHPDGTMGVDNEMFRVLGCLRGFRGPDGGFYIFHTKPLASRYNRLLIEITGVEDLSNDNEVTVTFYRGRDELMTDATGLNFVAGGSQRIDTEWGSMVTRQTRGKIVDHVLTTEPISEFLLPLTNTGLPTVHHFRDFRLKLTLTPTGAEGVTGGYVEIDSWMKQLTTNSSSHHLSAAAAPASAMYKVIRRLADAYPDPDTGQNTHISHAYKVEATQVFIIHPDEESRIATVN